VAIARHGTHGKNRRTDTPFTDGDRRALLGEPIGKEEKELLREKSRTGRPLATPKFIERLERMLGYPLRRRKPGPKPKAKAKGKVKGRVKGRAKRTSESNQRKR